MRKLIVLLLALLVVCAAVYGAAFSSINSTQDMVTWSQSTLVGDPSAVDGLNIRTTNCYSSSLLWETSCTLGPELTPQTEFSFSNWGHEWPYQADRVAISFSAFSSLSACTRSYLSESTAEKYSDLIEFYTDSLNNTSQYQEYSVDLADYMEYYPLEGRIEWENSYITFGEFQTYGFNIDQNLTAAIQEYFKIPMMRSVIKYTVDKRGNGATMGFETDYEYELYAEGVRVGNTIYFTFNALTKSGALADTSLIPGGYGIYAMTISETVDGEMRYTIDTVLPLNQEEEFIDLTLSSDSERLHLMTRVGQKLYLTVIDIESMTQVQKLEIMEDDDSYYTIVREDHFWAIVQWDHRVISQDTVRVLEEQADGTFTIEFTVPLNHRDFTFSDYITHTFSDLEMDYNGQTLVIASNAFENGSYWGDRNCDMTLIAYDADGMAYAGSYAVNLTTLYQDFYGNSHISPFGNTPVDVWW